MNDTFKARASSMLKKIEPVIYSALSEFVVLTLQGIIKIVIQDRDGPRCCYDGKRSENACSENACSDSSHSVTNPLGNEK